MAASMAKPRWWRRGDSNSRPSRCERDALPTELLPRGGKRGIVYHTTLRPASGFSKKLQCRRRLLFLDVRLTTYDIRDRHFDISTYTWRDVTSIPSSAFHCNWGMPRSSRMDSRHSPPSWLSPFASVHHTSGTSAHRGPWRAFRCGAPTEPL